MFGESESNFNLAWGGKWDVFFSVSVLELAFIQ